MSYIQLSIIVSIIPFTNLMPFLVKLRFEYISGTTVYPKFIDQLPLGAFVCMCLNNLITSMIQFELDYAMKVKKLWTHLIGAHKDVMTFFIK